MIKTRFGEDAKYIISKFIQDVCVTLACDFYVTKTGRIFWIATRECVVEDFEYVGGTMDWDSQGKYKERLYDKFVIPVAEYLHKKGYFGVVGIDVIASPSGDYLVDLNPRLNGSTSFALLAVMMAKNLEMSKSIFKLSTGFDCSSEDLVKKASSINETNVGRVVIMASADENKKCYATVAVFGDSMKLVEKLYTRLSE